MTSETRHFTLEDRAQISANLATYCELVDRASVDELMLLFASDVEVDYGPRARASGRGELATLFAGLLSACLSTSHHVTNIRIDAGLDGGATSISYVQAWHRLRQPAGAELTVLGRYVDRWERRDGQWLITHRLLHVHDADQPVSFHRLARNDLDEPRRTH